MAVKTTDGKKPLSSEQVRKIAKGHAFKDVK